MSTDLRQRIAVYVLSSIGDWDDEYLALVALHFSYWISQGYGRYPHAFVVAPSCGHHGVCWWTHDQRHAAAHHRRLVREGIAHRVVPIGFLMKKALTQDAGTYANGSRLYRRWFDKRVKPATERVVR